MKVTRLLKHNLCLGCGLCESIASDCKMRINDQGFYYPDFNCKITKSLDSEISQVCPSLNIRQDNKSSNSFWGNVLEINEGWSTDPDIRFHAASGGATTSIAISLIENNTVDKVLQVGLTGSHYLYNSLKISSSKADILECAQSRYAPALVFDNIFQILKENPNDRFAFIGKPCDVAAIRNLQKFHPEFKRQIIVCISIFCAGMPSYKATEKAWKQSGENKEPIRLKYRGDGWPGFFTAQWADGTDYKLDYNESWGKILGRSLGMRCKVCPDGIGELADIAIGDAWITKNGYPDFTEQDGKCFIMIRTTIGQEIYGKAVSSGYIESHKLDISNIAKMQPYQAERRKLTLWRLLPLQIKTGFLLNFKNMGIISLGIKANPKSAVRTLIGSIRRIF